MFRRTGRKNLYEQLRTETGWTPLCLNTPSRPLGGRIVTMWETLATSYRAWDLLNPVLDRKRKIGALYDVWVEEKGNVEAIRKRLAKPPAANDGALPGAQTTDGRTASDFLAPHAADFLTAYAAGGRVAGSVQNVTIQLRWLIPVDSPLKVPAATPAYLTQRLAAYPGGQNTRRKVHTSWSVFFAYCTTIAQLYPKSPMDVVERPRRYKPLPRFYEPDEVGQIIAAIASASMRALIALMYGTGIEISIAIGFRKRDFQEIEHGTQTYGEVRAPGTKEHTRDRVCIIAAWAWQIVKAYATDLNPGDPLWPGMHRTSADHAHRRVIKALGLEPCYALYNSRHHWAATRLRAGMPIELVQKQLGHASPRTTLEDYGRFLPSGADRAMWEARAGVASVGPGPTKKCPEAKSMHNDTESQVADPTTALRPSTETEAGSDA